MTKHLLDTYLPDMRAFYDNYGMLPTSENADIALIRSHLAYWQGSTRAEFASIKRSRGNSYRIAFYGKHDKRDYVARIVDYYDHRDGVQMQGPSA